MNDKNQPKLAGFNETLNRDIVNLEISRKGTCLEVSLFKGEQTLTHYEESPVSSQELEKRSNEMMHLLNMVSRRGTLPTSVVEEMQQMGRVLYNEIFPLSIKSQLIELPPSDLILRIDNTLVHVPWELLFDSEQFLCEKFNIGRMVKTQQLVEKRIQSKVSDILKILVIADPRSDLKASYEEGVRIRDQLQAENVKVTLITSEVSNDFLKKRLFNYDLIHYAGHADYDLEDPNRSGWLLEDGKFTTLDIRKMSGSKNIPWMVFSNACQSGQTEEWKIDETGEEKIYGLANAFLLSGIQHYIGTFWKVLDEPSTIFALKFYKNLLTGSSVGESMRSARASLREAYGEGNILWASYLLYGDPSVKYFHFSADLSEEELLVGTGNTSSLGHKSNYMSRNGLRTRSPSGNNGVYGWNYNDVTTNKTNKIFSRTHKWPLILAGGLILAFFMSFALIFYKTFKDLNKPTFHPDERVAQINNKPEYLKDVVKSGMASDDQIAEYFQYLAKRVNKRNNFDSIEDDRWTSRPIALFFVERQLSSEDLSVKAKKDILLHKMITILGADPRVTIIEREYLDTLLKELDLGSSPLASPDHNLSLGNIIAGNLFIISSIRYFEDKWLLNLRIVSSETSIVKSSFSETWDNSKDLEKIADTLAEKFLQELNKAFPVKGRIKHFLNEERVMLNIGSKQGVEKGLKLRVLKDNPILGNDGKQVATETLQIASLKVTEVKDRFSYAEVLDKKEDLSLGMKVSF